MIHAVCNPLTFLTHYQSRFNWLTYILRPDSLVRNVEVNSHEMKMNHVSKKAAMMFTTCHDFAEAGTEITDTDTHTNTHIRTVDSDASSVVGLFTVSLVSYLANRRSPKGSHTQKNWLQERESEKNINPRDE